MKQKILSIRHYSLLKPILGIIISGDPTNFLTAKILEDYELGKIIFKGDPVIYSSLSEFNDIRLMGGSTIAVYGKERQIIISPDKEFNSKTERREYERHPVSLSGNLRLKSNERKQSPVCLKDISYTGFRIYSHADLNTGDEIEVDIYLHNSILSITGTIMRKSLCYGRNEYGVRIVYKDKNSMDSIKSYMDKMLQTERELLKNQLEISMDSSNNTIVHGNKFITA